MNNNDLAIKIAALESCRNLAQQYVDGTIDWLTYWDKLPKNFEFFDPLDCSLEGLTPNQQREIRFYIEWHGGEFSEHEDLIPRKQGWQYGKSDEPYGWVDRERYLEEFSDALGELKKSLKI